MRSATLTLRAPRRAIVINPRLLGYSVRRYYDPATGQFISVDPAVDQTEASYAYAAGDPVDDSDPSGLLSLCGFGYCVSTHSFDPMASVDAAVNFGRGASFGLSDTIANWIVPGASCTVPQDAFDQFLGQAATSVAIAGGITGILRSMALRLPYTTVEGLGALGSTDAFGNISVDSGLEGQQLRETLLHEAVHSTYTKLAGTAISQATYSTAVGQVVEEWVAETFATGRPIEAVRFALGYLP
jgi:hypothetical protein